MNKSKSFQAVACAFGTLQCIVFGLAITITVYAGQAFTQSDVDVGSLEQIAVNWEKQPFTSVVASAMPCLPGQEPVYTYYWGGTGRGCFFQNRAGQYYSFANRVYRQGHYPTAETECNWYDRVAPTPAR
jgi:hypothetical protein